MTVVSWSGNKLIFNNVECVILAWCVEVLVEEEPVGATGSIFHNQGETLQLQIFKPNSFIF